MEFEQYYKGFGLDEYPFGVFTSEAEVTRFGSIYLKPANYSVIIEGLRNTSAVVIGERGTGKTSLSYDVAGELSKNKNLVVRIEEFSALKSDYQTEDLYRFIIERIAAEFFIRVADEPKVLWTYSKEDRVDLSLYLHAYLSTTTKDLLRDKINRIQNSNAKRFMLDAYNYSRVVLNFGMKAASKLASDILTQHFSPIPRVELDDTEYFRRLDSGIDQSFTAEQKQYFYLDKLCKLIKKFGIPKIYIIIDKVDEDPRFENDAEVISEYIRKIACDNKILVNDLFHVLLFVWSMPFNHIRESVRTQKLTFQSLEWDRRGLEQVLEKRLASYSNNKLTGLPDVLDDCSTEHTDLIFEMCNKNPRDLWHIIHQCFVAQFSIDSSRKIGNQAIETAVRKFVTDFNYYEYYPKKSKSRSNTMDVYGYIKHLLKLDDARFTKDKLSNMAGTGGSTNNYVIAMENMGLVKKTNEKTQNGAVIYEIRDPKVSYAMRSSIPIGE